MNDYFARKSTRVATAAAAAVAGIFLTNTNAQAAIACTTVTATNVSGIYTRTVALDRTGSISVTCTRAATDAITQVIYLSMNQGEAPAGRNMTRQTGTELLAYTLLRNPGPPPTGSWTTGAGRAAGATNAGGYQPTVNFGSTATLSTTATYPYYFRVAANITRAAGIYDDELVLITVKLGSSTGAVQSTTTFTVNASIQAQCYFSSAPTAMSLSYAAFSPTAPSAVSNFGVSCTEGTPYTMALDATSSVLVGLKYDLSLSSSGSTGTGFRQNYTATATIPAGQVGTCASAGACSATEARTITITY